MSNNKSEWVYILTNPSMPGLIKIGMTTRDPYVRASELASQTGIPTKFEVAYAVKVNDSYSVEQSVHEKLGRYRINKNREFFKIDVNKAKKIIDNESKRYQVAKISKKRGLIKNVVYSLLITFIITPTLLAFLEINVSDERLYYLGFVLILFIFIRDDKNPVGPKKYKKRPYRN